MSEMKAKSVTKNEEQQEEPEEARIKKKAAEAGMLWWFEYGVGCGLLSHDTAGGCPVVRPPAGRSSHMMIVSNVE